MRQARRALLVVCVFVSPLLFFTNLTRNPYVTQICLLNLGLVALAALTFVWEGTPLPRTPIDGPIVAWLGVCALSWLVSYFGHGPFFRPAIASEGARNAVFLLVNGLAPFYLAADAWRRGKDSQPPKLGPWIAFAALWGLLWTAFPQLRGPGAAPADIFGHVWDGYGALLWATGIAAVYRLCRSDRGVDWLHLALLAGFLASVYGVMQYFNFEFIWPTTLNPYGGRSVSTFGNPNFASSYNVILLPFAAVLFLRSRGARRLAYGAVVMALAAALLCSLTRSSWLGAVVSLGMLGFIPEVRRELREQARPAGLVLGACFLMALLWPQSLTGGYSPSVLGRIREMKVLLQHSGAAYSPWHQRNLIWMSAWLMGRENPLTGKGFGCFELFYPFYQGPILGALAFFRVMRTHANNAHNEILEVFSQTGLLGLGVFLWLWATFFRACRPLFCERGEDVLPAAAAAGAAGMLTDNLLNVSIHFAVPGFLFWWVVGTSMGAVDAFGASAPTLSGASRKEGATAQRVSIASQARRWVVALLSIPLAWYWVCTWNREAHYFAGFKLVRQSAFGAAARELEAACAWGPPEVNTIYELGNAYARSQRFEDAVKTYERALRANAGYDEIFFNVAAIENAHLGRAPEAIENLRMAWWINPLSADVYNSLANIYLREPRRYAPQAEELLRHAVAIFPRDPNHWNNLGYLYSITRRFGQAEDAYTRALLIDPNLAVAERNLAALTRDLGHRPKILDGLDVFRRLEARIGEKDYSEATLALAGQALKQFPDLPRARLLWGSLLLARGRAAEAREPLEWAAAHDDADPWTHANLAEDYLALGRRDDAVRELRTAVSLSPQNPALEQRLKILTSGS